MNLPQFHPAQHRKYDTLVVRSSLTFGSSVSNYRALKIDLVHLAVMQAEHVNCPVGTPYNGLYGQAPLERIEYLFKDSTI